MNSLDPWRFIAEDAYGDIVSPRPYFGHPFHREVPSWVHYDSPAHGGTTRQLFDGALVGRDLSVGAGADDTVFGRDDIIGANMTNNVGAELTALSAPGFGFGYPLYGTYAPYGAYRPYGGVFFGADTPAAHPPPPPADRRTGVLADVAPVVAPATGDVAVKKELDGKQILHVEICVDGKCYRTSMDLAPAIAMLMEKLTRLHTASHAAAQPPLSTVVSTVGNAIDVAGDAMADIMVGQHVATMTSGWLSDIGGAIGGTLRKLQPIISTVATGVATAYGGPAAGAAAAKLSPMITGFQADLLDPKGSPAKKAAAQAALAKLQQQAAADPAKAQALAAANQAVKNTTVAYHVKDTAQQAAAGNVQAQTDINALVTAAEQGDPVAKSTFDVLAQTFAQQIMKSEAGAKLWEQITGRGPGTVSPGVSGWYDIIGCVAEAPLLPSSYPVPLSGWYAAIGADPKTQALALIRSAIEDVAVAEDPDVSPISGHGFKHWYWVLYPPRGGGVPFASVGGALSHNGALEEARKLQRELRPLALAVFDKTSPHWPNPVAWTRVTASSAYDQAIAQRLAQPARNRSTSFAVPLSFGPPPLSTEAPPPPPPIGQWYDIYGDTTIGSNVVVGSFWSKVKNGLLTVTLTKQTNQFIKDNKLEPYVKLAATAVATAYGGPAAGAAAGALSGPVMSLGVEDKQQSASAQRAVQGVKAKAQQTNPGLAPAVDVAQAAIDQTATAYQVSQMVKDAKAGNPDAQKALADLQAAASRGDENAQAALQAAAALDREQQGASGPTVGQWYDIADTVVRLEGSNDTAVGQWYDLAGPAVGQWYDIVGSAIDDVREKARTHAVTKPGAAAGVVTTVDGRQHGRGFRNLDDAIDWLQHITRNRSSFTYAAAYEKDSAGAAYIQAEEFGNAPAQAAPMTTAAG